MIFRFIWPWRHFANHLQRLTEGIHQMSEALDRLTREVEETRGVAASATAALVAMPGLIRQAVADALANAEPVDAALNALADKLDAAQGPLAAAVQANSAPADDGGDDTLPAEGDDTVPADDAE